jgi:hypothetical protein
MTSLLGSNQMEWSLWSIARTYSTRSPPFSTNFLLFSRIPDAIAPDSLGDGNDGSRFDGRRLGLVGDQLAQERNQHNERNTDGEAAGPNRILTAS